MITDNDIKKMRVVFATKDDLREMKKVFATKRDLRAFATKKDLRAMENRMVRKFNEVIDFFDDSIIDHEKRIKSLEAQNPLALNV